MPETAIAVPAELSDKVANIVQWANGLIVADAVTYERAGTELKVIKGVIGECDATFKPMKQAIDASKQVVLDQEKKHRTPLTTAESIIKDKMAAFARKQLEIAQAEQKRLNDEANAKRQKEIDDNLAKAAAAKRPETIAKYEEKAAMVPDAPVVTVAPATPKVEGISMRKKWRGQITDLTAFLEFVYANKREDLVTPNQKMIDSIATTMNERASIPGVRFFTEDIVSASRR